MKYQIFKNLSHHGTSVSKWYTTDTYCLFWNSGKFISYVRFSIFRKCPVLENQEKYSLCRCENPLKIVQLLRIRWNLTSCISVTQSYKVFKNYLHTVKTRRKYYIFFH